MRDREKPMIFGFVQPPEKNNKSSPRVKSKWRQGGLREKKM